MKPDTYIQVGVSLTVLGELFTVYCYLVVRSVPLTALGIALAILGASISILSQNPVPTEAIRGMVEGDRHEQFVLVLYGLMMATVVILTALREARLEVYVSLIAVCYFATSELFHPRRRWFDVVGAALFIALVYIVALKIP